MKYHQLTHFLTCWGFHDPLVRNLHGPGLSSIFLTAQLSAVWHLTESPLSARVGTSWSETKTTKLRLQAYWIRYFCYKNNTNSWHTARVSLKQVWCWASYQYYLIRCPMKWDYHLHLHFRDEKSEAWGVGGSYTLLVSRRAGNWILVTLTSEQCC